MATENIPSRLHSVAQGNVVTGANEILDDDKGKKQNVINQENDQRLETLEAAVGTGGSVDSRIESAKTEIVGGASSDCNTLGKAETLISTNANDIAALQEAYAALTQNDVVVVAPADIWPVATPEQNTIYRVVDRTNTPPQYYADYMWNGTAMVEMAQYNNAIDAVPTAGSHNLVESGGVQNELALGAVYDVTAHNSNATFDSLEALLSDANLNTLIPTSVRKGGMSIKFVQSSDNKYVQYRLMADEWSTTEADWQGVDTKLLAGSHNFIENGNLKKVINNATLNTRCVDVVDFPTSRHSSSYYYINGVTLYSGHTYLISCSSDTSITSSQLSVKFVDSNKNNLASKNIIVNDTWDGSEKTLTYTPSLTLYNCAIGSYIGTIPNPFQLKIEVRDITEHYIKYDEQQSLSNAQKAQVLSNIGVDDELQYASQTIVKGDGICSKLADSTINNAICGQLELKANSSYSATYIKGLTFKEGTTYIMKISSISSVSGALNIKFVDGNSNVLKSVYVTTDNAWDGNEKELSFTPTQTYKNCSIASYVGYISQNTSVNVSLENTIIKKTSSSLENQIPSIDKNIQALQKCLNYALFDTTGKIAQGGVNTDGSFSNVADRIRINQKIYNSGIKLKISSGAANLNWFNREGEIISGSNSGWITPRELTYYDYPNAFFCTIHFKSASGGNITPSDFASLGVELYTYRVIDADFDTIDKKSIEVSDGFSLTAASASHLQISSRGICYCTYLGSRTGIGEAAGLVMLSVFPINQPFRQKHFVVAEGNNVFESNCLLINDTTLRIFYFDNGYNTDNTVPKTNYYKDFNINTEVFGEQTPIKINIGGESVDLTQIEIKNYLQSINIPASYIWGCIMTCRPVKKDGYWYMAITSSGTNDGSSLFGGQPILFVRSTDGFANCEIVGVLNISNEYECQIEWDATLNKWHILTRHGGINYCSTEDFETFSIETMIYNSVQSRPQIIKYKNNILVVTNKVNNTMEGKVGGVSNITGRSRIVGQILNPSDVNASQVIFDMNSPFGIVYPSVIGLNGLLYMTYSNGRKMTAVNNDGKLAVQYYVLGELDSDITGYVYNIL